MVGGRTVPAGLAPRGRCRGCRGWLLRPVSCPGGALAAPGGLRALDGGLPPTAVGAFLGPSGPPLLFAAPPGQGLPLNTTSGSFDPHRGLVGAGSKVWAMLPPHLLCGHVKTGQRGSEAQHEKVPSALWAPKASYAP